MIKVIITEEFERRYAELPKSVQKKAERQERIFRANPFHPSLHTEKLEPRSKQLWSFRVDRKYRVLFRFSEANTVIFLTTGPHNWIYDLRL